MRAPFFIIIVLCNFYSCRQPETVNLQSTSYKDKKAYEEYVYAVSLFNTKNDSAFYFFNKIARNSEDSILIVGSYTYLGMIQHNVGDYFGSQESMLESIKLLDEKNKQQYENLASNYNGLGDNNLSLKDYDEAIRYFNLALSFSNNMVNRLIILNNIATAYKEKKQYIPAIKIYDSILKNIQNSPIDYARILSNKAKTKWLQDSNYNAASELTKALLIREKEKDTIGLNASYSHLSDYYAKTQPDIALTYALKMYSIAQGLNSPNDQLEALEKLMALGEPKEVRKYFNRYRFLNDSVQTSRNNAKNQFALIRYETEKHKSENLNLQKENAEKKVRIIQQWGILLGIIVLAVLVFQWYRKQKERAMREQQLRTSQKVHDVVANGLYNVMSKIEHEKTGGKEQLLIEMGVLYEQSRNISYEEPKTIRGDIQQIVIGLLQSFASDTTNVLIVGEDKALWESLTPKVKKELPLILQNLMTNMKKHSQAASVVIKFDKQEKQLSIQYTDDGVGLPAGFKYGNGLKNTESRIHGLGGRLIFDHSPAKGVKLNIYIPTP